MIGNIQFLRGLAALSVVYYHTDHRMINNYHIDFGGVSIFFVISGFIMVLVTRDDAAHFVARRVLRIVPLYWFMTFFAIAWFGFGFSNPPYVWPLLGKWAISDWPQLSNWFSSQFEQMANYYDG